MSTETERTHRFMRGVYWTGAGVSVLGGLLLAGVLQSANVPADFLHVVVVLLAWLLIFVGGGIAGLAMGLDSSEDNVSGRDW